MLVQRPVLEVKSQVLQYDLSFVSKWLLERGFWNHLRTALSLWTQKPFQPSRSGWPCGWSVDRDSGNWGLIMGSDRQWSISGKLLSLSYLHFLSVSAFFTCFLGPINSLNHSYTAAGPLSLLYNFKYHSSAVACVLKDVNTNLKGWATRGAVQLSALPLTGFLSKFCFGEMRGL